MLETATKPTTTIGGGAKIELKNLKHSDFAGLYFSGNRPGAMEAIFKQYIEQEIHWNQEITP